MACAHHGHSYRACLLLVANIRSAIIESMTPHPQLSPNIMPCVPPTSARGFTCKNQIPMHTLIFDLLPSMHACYMMLLHMRHAITLSFQLPFLVREADTQHVTCSDQ
jgi:hypothetical protein